MTLVDSTVWVDCFRIRSTAQTGLLEGPLDVQDRKLRSLGVTVRGTVGVVLATWCIVSVQRLLHSDRDFDAFEKHQGLLHVFSEA